MAYYKQANLFQVHQTLFSIEKNVNAAWKMYLDIQCTFYIDPEPYQWQEIQRKVKSTLHTPMATEGVLENVGQSRKHLDKAITLKNKCTCSLNSVFFT